MADTETMSKKNEEKKRIRKRVKTANKKPKKAKKKVTVEDSQATIDKMVGNKDSIKDATNHPDKVATLMSKTELSEASIRSQHESFMKECPEGEMTKEKFVELSEVAKMEIFPLFGKYLTIDRKYVTIIAPAEGLLASLAKHTP